MTLLSIIRFTGYLIVGIVAFLLIVAGFSVLLSPPVSPKDIHIVEVSGTLAQSPEIHSYGKHTYIRLLLNKYANRSFNIDGDAYYATKWLAMDEIYTGDSVYMEVSADDYKNNLANRESPKRMLPVAVFGLRNKDHIFLSLTDYCKETNANANAWVGVVLLVIGSVFTFALYSHLKQKRKRRHII